MNLEELAALNDEISALVRAGVPLDEGLEIGAREWSGATGRRGAELGERLARGESLEQVLADPTWSVPPAYLAVVAAGQRSGRLAAALEGVAQSARLVLETRRVAASVLLYPVILAALAYGLLLLTMHLASSLAFTPVGSLDGPTTPWQTGLRRAVDTMPYWSWLPPLLFATLFYWWWNRSLGRLGRVGRTLVGRRSKFRWSASPALVQQLGDYATFAEVLALLVEHGVPLTESLPLAGRAANDREVQATCLRIAERLNRGEVAQPENSSSPGLWFEWLIVGQVPDLARHLRATAASYRSDALYASRWLNQSTPLLFMVGIAIISVGCYLALLFVPYTDLLRELSRP